jgi:hypothetical protein
MRLLLLIAMLGAGCEHDLLAGLRDAAIDPPDAYTGTGCPPAAEPLAAGTYKLYLNTEGVTLTAGASDARANISDIPTAGPHVVPPFLDGVAGREDFIAQIATSAQSVLAPYSIDIVTERPSSGDYYMFVLGGDPMTVTGKPCVGCNAISDFNCMLQTRDDVDLMFDNGMADPYTSTYYATTLLDDLSAILGFPVTTPPHDCASRFADLTGPLCTFGSFVATSNGVNTMTGFHSNCGITPDVDETAELKQALGCR